MKTKIAVIATALFAAVAMFGPPTISCAQTIFQKTYGGSANDAAYFGGQTNDGGYIVAGGTFNFAAGDYDFYLIKLDAFGDTMWTKSIGINTALSWEEANTVQQTSDSGYIICGSVGSNPHDIYIVKTNAAGAVQWNRLFTNVPYLFSGEAAQQTTDGGYIVFGYVYFGITDGAICLIKLDANGNTTWSKYISESATIHEFATFGQQTSDGGYILFARNSNIESLLVKTDSAGSVLWTKKYTGLGECYFVQETTDGGLVLLGTAGNPYDIYLIKTNSTGDTLWTKTYGGSSIDDASSVKQTTDGGFIIAGTSQSFGAGSRDAYLVKTDSAGTHLWSKVYGGASLDFAYSAQQTNDGGYIVMGQSFGAGQLDCYVLKTDSNGNTGCNEMNAATVTGTIAFQVSTATLLATTGPTASIPPYTTLGGAIVTTPCFSTNINEISSGNSLLIYPNPTSGSVTVAFTLSEPGEVTLEVFDMTGRYVTTVAHTAFEEASNVVAWDANEVNQGIYFLKMNAGSYSAMKRISVIK